jgi:hypothetical protein
MDQRKPNEKRGPDSDIQVETQTAERRLRLKFTAIQYVLFFLFLCACSLQILFLSTSRVVRGVPLWMTTWTCMICMFILCVIVSLILEDGRKDFKLQKDASQTSQLESANVNGGPEPLLQVKKEEEDADVPVPSPDTETNPDLPDPETPGGDKSARLREPAVGPRADLKNFQEKFKPNEDIEIEFVGCWWVHQSY